MCGVASVLGCKVASFPALYLGVPLCKCKPWKACWDKIIEKWRDGYQLGKVKSVYWG